MVNVSKYFKDYCRQSGRERVDCYLIIGGRKVTKKDIESIKVTYTLGNNNIPSIGNACSATLYLSLYRRGDVPNYLYEDKTVIPYIGFQVFNEKSNQWYYEYVKMGTFYIPNSDNVTKNDLKITLTCFDNMARMGDNNRKRVQIDNNKPEIPTGTVTTVCQYLARKAGITFDYSSIEEDVPIKVSPAGKNVRQVLQELAFIQGKNVIVDRDDKFKFVKPTKVEYKDFNIKAKNITSLNWAADLYSNIAALQCVQLNYTRYDDEVDDSTHTYEIIDRESINYDPDDYDSMDILQNKKVTGVGFHTSIITSTDDLMAVYNRCMPNSYYKFSMSTQGFPQVEVGDIITITTNKGDERDLIIASHEVTYDGGCISKFVTNGSDSEYLDVEDIKWWNLVTKTDATTESNNQTDLNQSSIGQGSDIFDYNYMEVETKRTKEDNPDDVDLITEEIWANNLIKFESDENNYLTKVKVGELGLRDKSGEKGKEWYLKNIVEYLIGSSSGGGCNCDLTDIYNRLTYLEKCCEEMKNNVPDDKKFTLIIYYKYSDGSTAAPTYTKVYLENSNYSVISPTIEGYTCDKPTVSGKITADTKITVIYSKETSSLIIPYNPVSMLGGVSNNFIGDNTTNYKYILRSIYAFYVYNNDNITSYSYTNAITSDLNNIGTFSKLIRFNSRSGDALDFNFKTGVVKKILDENLITYNGISGNRLEDQYVFNYNITTPLHNDDPNNFIQMDTGNYSQTYYNKTYLSAFKCTYKDGYSFYSESIYIDDFGNIVSTNKTTYEFEERLVVNGYDEPMYIKLKDNEFVKTDVSIRYNEELGLQQIGFKYTYPNNQMQYFPGQVVIKDNDNNVYICDVIDLLPDKNNILEVRSKIKLVYK